MAIQRKAERFSAMDGRDDTRWATDEGTTSAWLEVDLGKPATFSRSVLRQAFPELKRIHKFAVEYLRPASGRRAVKAKTPAESSGSSLSPSLPSGCG